MSEPKNAADIWSAFCDDLKSAGNFLVGDSVPDDDFDRAEGLRFLSRLVRASFETYIENGDAHAPVLRCVAHETIKMGADNPDNRYLSAPINGRCEYRISGHRGTVHYLGFGSQTGNYGATGSLNTDGYVEAGDLEIGDDGYFELTISSEKREGNWLPMKPESRLLVVRQTFNDRSAEVAADLRIERIDGPHVPRPLTLGRMEAALGGSALFVAGCADFFGKWVAGFQGHKNELPLFDRDVATAAGGIPDVAYYHSYWELEPDEALVVEVTPPHCDYWNFQLNNHWMESLDYRYARIAINGSEVKMLGDGSVRLVVAHEDPGVANWLETTGHARGTMCLRWIRADEHPTPRTRVIKLSELRSAAS